MKTPMASCAEAKSRSGRVAFTLIELLVVIAIMAILAALSLLAMKGVKSKSLADKTRVDIAAIANALEQYKSVNDEYPETLTAAEGVPDSILHFLGSSKVNISGDGQLIDAFGNPYMYTPGTNDTRNPASFDIWSEGPTDNEGDNIGNW